MSVVCARGESALEALSAHFDDCSRQGTPRQVWWRDDDAGAPGPKLDALMMLAQDTGAPVALAVIPHRATAALMQLCETRDIDVLQHGVRHANHQPSGKSAELGDGRPIEVIMSEVVAARALLSGGSVLEVMVPPWNRMRIDLMPALGDAGYAGVSQFGGPPQKGVPYRVDTHIDPVAWRTTRTLASDSALRAMTEAAIGTEGPIGLLTHHMDHDTAISEFVSAFAQLVCAHPGAQWVSAKTLFARP
ncbi:MAG: hypothetical protein AAGJ94_00965 [Pseudomonadota bacterium]